MTMSSKIKAKDLSYDSALPPFLQRLHDQKAGRGDTDRHERQAARPKRAKDPNDDDGPTMVDESGESVSKEEYERLTKADAETEGPASGGVVEGNGQHDAAVAMSGAPLAEDGKKPHFKATTGPATKKRKAAKVVGDHDGDEEPALTATAKGDKVATEKKPAAKPKKKAKAIKLAFDDADEG